MSNEKKSKTKSKSKNKAVEDIYKEKTLHEHIATMPDTYVGSVKADKREIFVFESDESKMEKRVIDYIGAFYKIFDEIIVNARDHTVRDSSCKNIRIDIDKETGYISIWNDGNGIPVEFHNKSKKYVPHMIFGTLLTSSNYDKSGKITGGKNGYGAKCTNIYSKEFIVDTVDSKNRKKYIQRFYDNMYGVDDPIITDVSKKEKPYCCIKYLPDYKKFGMKHITNDMYDLLIKRGYDLAACTSNNIKVWINGKEVKCRKLNDYIKLYYNKTPKLIYEKINSRWKVGIVFDKDCGFNQVSFVNGICTLRGGTHVSHVVDQIVRKVTEAIHSQSKYKLLKIKRSLITDNLAVYISAVIEDPAFDSQTKETLNTKISDYGTHKDSRCTIPDTFIKDLLNTGLEKEVIKYAEFKAQDELKKTDGKKMTNLHSISKLEDAHWAGGRKSDQCRLFITEGDSAKAFAISGFSVIGKERYGVFPIRGKFLNVKSATSKQLLNNEEFKHIKQILGLKQNIIYNDTKKLRYGGVIILTDQDVDGSHIKGLIMNMLETYWPSLLSVNGFIQTINTPIVKVWKKNDKKKKSAICFYTLSDYTKWITEKTKAKGSDNISRWESKYYKGLGTSSNKEAKEIFRDFSKNLLTFTEKDCEKDSDNDSSDENNNTDDEISVENLLSESTINCFDLAFDKNKSDNRKIWLSSYNKDDILQYDDSMTITFPDFVNKDLKHFSNYDNLRSIPCIMDGFKPSHRKIMYAVFKRGYNAKEIKVAQLAGYVALHTEYHHNEDALKGTIIGLAQNYVGSNNINFLSPNGNFGYRNENGKDHASPRYIFTELESITMKIFKQADENILDYIEEDGHLIEPEYYAPIIPTILVNGANGIGTGYSSKIPTFNPTDIINNIKKKLKNKNISVMTPWFKGFNGTIEKVTPEKYLSTGCFEILDRKTVYITEIPIDKSISQYKIFLESKLPKNRDDTCTKIESIKSDSLNHKVSFTVKFRGNELKKLIRNSNDSLIKYLKLTSVISLTNLHLYNENGKIVKYDYPEDILEDFYEVRYKMYEKRIEYVVDKLKNQFNIIDYKIRYIEHVIDKTIKVQGNTRNKVIDRLEELEYPKLNSDHLAPKEKRTYKYLTDLSLLSLTNDKIAELKEERKLKKKEYDDYLNTSVEDRWLKELSELELEYKQWLKISLDSLVDDEEEENKSKKKSKKSKKKKL
jgi:DNA topoisomerase II